MKEFTKLFEQLSHRHDNYRVFDDFLTIAICCFSFGKMEQEYLDTIKGYSKQELELFSKMLGALIMEYEQLSDTAGGWGDGLGQFFEESNGKFSRDSAGQFFTPPAICQLAAGVLYEHKDEGVTVNDCACGSGRTLIAFDRQNASNRFKNFYTGQDVDYRCVRMCTINFFLYGMRGVVIHMNTLSQEIWRGFRLWMPETGMAIQPLSKEECYQYLYQPKEITETKEKVKESAPVPFVKIEAGQMTIF